MGEIRISRHTKLWLLAATGWLAGAGLVITGVTSHLAYPFPIPYNLDLRLIGALACTGGLLTLALAVWAVQLIAGHSRIRSFAISVLVLGLQACLLSLAWLYRDYSIHDEIVPSRGADLAATLLVPHGPGPHPGVVLVHGTSPDLRRSYIFYADFFARRGIAVISYDKRGKGASTGELEFAGLSELSADAGACYARLGAHPRVDPGRIGFWGYSQGGAVGPLAALDAGNAAFVISLSGPGTTLGEQMMHVHNKVPATQPAGKLRDRVWQYWHDRQGYPGLYADLQSARDEAWYSTCGFPPKLLSPEDELALSEGLPFRWMGPYMNHDPINIFTQLDCPVAFFFGVPG